MFDAKAGSKGRDFSEASAQHVLSLAASSLAATLMLLSRLAVITIIRLSIVSAWCHRLADATPRHEGQGSHNPAPLSHLLTVTVQVSMSLTSYNSLPDFTLQSIHSIYLRSIF